MAARYKSVSYTYIIMLFGQLSCCRCSCCIITCCYNTSPTTLFFFFFFRFSFFSLPECVCFVFFDEFEKSRSISTTCFRSVRRNTSLTCVCVCVGNG